MTMLLVLQIWSDYEPLRYVGRRPVNVVLTELGGPARSSRPSVTLGDDGHLASVSQGLVSRSRSLRLGLGLVGPGLVNIPGI